MGNHISIIHLPAQSGKTRKMTELINRWNSLCEEFSGKDATGNEINIIFTSNTKLLSKQTANRIHNEVDMSDTMSDITADSDDDTLSVDMDCSSVNKTIAWVDSKKVKDKEMVADIILSTINNIICCSNKARMEHVFAVLEMLNELFINKTFKKRVNIWIDEADASIRLWNVYLKKFNKLIDSDLVKNIVFVSATMIPVYKYLHSQGIVPHLHTYENTHAPMYHKYTESILTHKLSDDAKNIDEQLRSILEQNRQYINAGTKWFCPGAKNKKSHEKHCETLLEFGFNVLLLNGENKEFRMASGEIVTISDQLEDDLEIAKTLNKMYYEYSMYNAPFAVTGNICVSRGITFASKNEVNGNEFMFTHGIIPDTTNGEDAYQMVARCIGNIKEYNTYKLLQKQVEDAIGDNMKTYPMIFVSSKTHNLIVKQEEMAVSFAKKYWKNEDAKIAITADMLLSNNTHTQSRISKNDPRKKIPIIVSITKEDVDTLLQCSRIERRNRIIALLQTNATEFQEIVGSYTLVQCTCPNTDSSYKKHIIDIVNASELKRPFIIDQNHDDINKNWMNVYIDNRNYRLCVVMWNGAPMNSDYNNVVSHTDENEIAKLDRPSEVTDNTEIDFDEQERQLLEQLERLRLKKQKK